MFSVSYQSVDGPATTQPAQQKPAASVKKPKVISLSGDPYLDDHRVDGVLGRDAHGVARLPRGVAGRGTGERPGLAELGEPEALDLGVVEGDVGEGEELVGHLRQLAEIAGEAPG